MSYTTEKAVAFASKIKALGFTVYMAKSRQHGFITDNAETRVLTFSANDRESIRGNYGPPSQQSGTGWQVLEGLHNLNTAHEVHQALYATPPGWCGNGWKYFTSVKLFLKAYGESSGYQKWEG